jgi:hypothetical protein
MAYKNPMVATNTNSYDQDLTVQEGYSTVLSGPITIPNVTVNGGSLNVIGTLEVSNIITLTDTVNYNTSINIIG